MIKCPQQCPSPSLKERNKEKKRTPLLSFHCWSYYRLRGNLALSWWSLGQDGMRSDPTVYNLINETTGFWESQRGEGKPTSALAFVPIALLGEAEPFCLYYQAIEGYGTICLKELSRSGHLISTCLV